MLKQSLDAVMAMSAVSRTTTHQATTPLRPSISPLSTVSRANKSSPTATRDATMHESEALEDVDLLHATDAADAEIAEHLDDGSSSLSDPEDENENENEHPEQHNGIDDDTADDEQLLAQTSLEVDSEAETERLDQTPQKLRKHADSLGRTPSKLSQAATAEEELSDPPSPLPAGADAASSTSTVATAGELTHYTHNTTQALSGRSATDMRLLGQKRKRSDTAESSLTSAESDIGESPRKRSHELDADAAMEGGDAIESAEGRVVRAEDTPMPDEVQDTPSLPTKSMKGRKGKQKGKKHKEQEQAEEAEREHVPEPEPEEEPTSSAPGKTSPQLAQKLDLTTTFQNITTNFLTFKSQLTTERLATLTTELHSLHAPQTTHPEYLRQKLCLDTRLKKQTSETHAYYTHALRALRRRTLAERSQLHSQYFQHVRDEREDVLAGLSEKLYAIQNQRRESYGERGDDAWIYKFPARRGLQVRRQAEWNREVEVLSGVARWVGFPAAPEVKGVAGEGEEDLRAMKVSRGDRIGYSPLLCD